MYNWNFGKKKKQKSITTHSAYVKHLNKKQIIRKCKIKKNDVLFVIDMQNDFINRKYKDGKKSRMGKLPTFDSKGIIKRIVMLIKRFKKRAGAKVIATRDYHPKKPKQHCSFPIFGEHCVWKTAGSDIVKEIQSQLVKSNKFCKDCHIVFKAFNHKIDSFGAFPYKKKYALGRICGCSKKTCPISLTGAKGLVKWVKYPNMKKRSGFKKLPTFIRKTNKKNNALFICGVLGDFCVLDTAINACQQGYKKVYVVVDLIRNLRIKQKGKIVYPTSPDQYSNLAKKYGFKFVLSKNVH
jgi:nicotinamidase-related amidase